MALPKKLGAEENVPSRPSTTPPNFWIVTLSVPQVTPLASPSTTVYDNLPPGSHRTVKSTGWSPSYPMPPPGPWNKKQGKKGAAAWAWILRVKKPLSYDCPSPPHIFAGGKHTDRHNCTRIYPALHTTQFRCLSKCLVNTISLLQPRLCLNSITLISSWQSGAGVAIEIIWATSPYGKGYSPKDSC